MSGSPDGKSAYSPAIGRWNVGRSAGLMGCDRPRFVGGCVAALIIVAQHRADGRRHRAVMLGAADSLFDPISVNAQPGLAL